MTTPATLRGVPLTGLRLGAPLGSGSAGVAWAATTEGGDRVAVRVLPDATAPAHAARERRLDVLRSLHHPGLAAVRTMPGHVDDRLVVTDLVPGPTLATVRTGRMGLPAAEALTLAHGLASAIAELHRHGLVHGDVSPTNVVLAERDEEGLGHPVLVDLLADLAGEAGTTGFVAPEVRGGRAPGPAADVWALATMCVWATRVGDRDMVARALGGAASDDPQVRPSAAALAAHLADQATAPVQVPPPSVLAGAALREHAQRAPTVLRPTRRRRARHRRAAPVRSAVVAVLVTVVVGLSTWLLWPEGQGEQSAQGRSAVGPAPSMTEVVADLLVARDAALVAADAAALADVTVEGSPARADDLALLDSLEGIQLSGLHTAVGDTAVVEATDTAAQVQAVLTQGEHERTSAGATETVPAQEPRCVVLTLRLDGPQWAVERVSDCS